MEKIPTSEEFLKQERFPFGLTIHAMEEFAKMHVTLALKAASEKASVYADEGGYSEFVDEESILNSYPLENIK